MPLTHRARGGDDRRFRQDLHYACAHRRSAAAVGVQVTQELLDDQVGVLRLREEDELGLDSNPTGPQPSPGTQRRGKLKGRPSAPGTAGGTGTLCPFLHPSLLPPTKSQIPVEASADSVPGPFYFKMGQKTILK